MSDEPRLRECWVWIGIDPVSNEAEILGYRIGKAHMPLIAVTPEDAANNSVIARQLHSGRVDSPDLYHFHFTQAEELEKLA